MKVVAPITVEEKTITYSDPIVPIAYVEKPPFLVRIKDHVKASTVVRKSNTRTPTPPEQIKVETSIDMVKDLLADNIDGHVIYFCDEAAIRLQHIYNFCPREGKSIALAWWSLKSMLYSCPNHELSREIIIQKIYARLSHNDRSMLDTSCIGSFMKKDIEYKWDLLERIKRNF